MKPLLILKIGGSLITHKHKEEPSIDYENLRRISKEIPEGFDKEKNSLIIIHGAGSYGHPIVKKTEINKGINNYEQVLAFAETQKLQNELNSIVCEELIKVSIPAIPVQASASAIMDNKVLKHMDINVVKGFLETGLVPVLYGVPAYDKKQKCSILSGDEIITYLAKKLKTEKMIHATDVDGVFTTDPKKDENAQLINEITPENFEKILQNISGSTHTDVTGGMFNKIKKLLEVNVVSEIINGNKEGNIKRVLQGENSLGTVVRS